MIRIIHTADWHLGKRLENCERADEHRYFLNWLIQVIGDKEADVLIVAGDIFDTGNPSNQSLKMYYDFLWKVSNTCCKNVIIIGGNHDSVSTLDAPKDLLKICNVHVVGGVPEKHEDQIIVIENEQHKPQLVVCAVPFLRDKDVRRSVSGETITEQETRLKQGIMEHYNYFKEFIYPFKQKNIPVIATGHLYTAGAASSDSEQEIYVGNLGRVSGDQFPAEFDYIALGHLHRPQMVNKMAHIRYSGSPVPLSFSEADDCKEIIFLEFENGKLTHTEQIAIPRCRKLYRIKGNLETVKAKLALIPENKFEFPPWVEIQLETDSIIHDAQEQLEKIAAKKNVEQIFLRQVAARKKQEDAERDDEFVDLTQLDAKSVFKKKCESAFPEKDITLLLKTFDEALELFRSQEN